MASLPNRDDSARAILPMPVPDEEPIADCTIEVLRPAVCRIRYFAPGDAAGDLGSGEHRAICCPDGSTVVVTARPPAPRLAASRTAPTPSQRACR